jgi:hypothetical protein
VARQELRHRRNGGQSEDESEDRSRFMGHSVRLGAVPLRLSKRMP